MGVRAFGAVLAGGRSRRLGGQDKALLDLGEGPVLGRTLALLRPRTTGIAVFGDSHRHAGFGVPVVPDRHPGCGPLGGLDAALTFSEAPHVLLVGCDLPFIGERLLDALLDAPTDLDAVVPVLRGLDEPLCARYAVSLGPVVEEAILAGRRRMSSIYSQRRVLRLDVVGLGIATAEELHNINSPEDLEAARALAARRG